jgi:hypothetical protein
MKLPIFFYYKYDEHSDTRIGIGVDWSICRESPLYHYRRTDRDYYKYVNLSFKFISHSLNIDIYYKLMPYRDYDQYLTFIRAERNNV